MTKPEYSEPRFITPWDSQPSVFKIWGPLVCWTTAGVFGTAAMNPSLPLRAHVTGGIFASLIAVAGFFMFSLALIQATNRGVRYRRFLQWHFVPYDQIRKCGTVIGFGKLTLTRAVWPWKSLYFIFFLPNVSPFKRGKAIEEEIARIRVHLTRDQSPTSLSVSSEQPVSADGVIMRTGLWVGLGAAMAFGSLWLRSWLPLIDRSYSPVFPNAWERFYRSPLGLVLLAVLLAGYALAVVSYIRRRVTPYVLAFTLGVGVIWVLALWYGG